MRAIRGRRRFEPLAFHESAAEMQGPAPEFAKEEHIARHRAVLRKRQAALSTDDRVPLRELDCMLDESRHNLEHAYGLSQAQIAALERPV